MRKWLSAIRLVRSGKKRLLAIMNSRTARKAVETLIHSSHPHAVSISEVLTQLQHKLPQTDSERVMQIENERQHLLNRHEPLIDGTLGEGGLYDENRTIALACEASKGPRAALMLYLLTRALKPERVLELGTNLGISSAYLGAALESNGPTGRLVTLDASPYRQRLAKEIHANLGLQNITYVSGLFSETLGDTLRVVDSVDLVFIDGHHQYGPTLAYLAQILSFAAANAVFVFDDIRWSEEMKKAWADIQADKRFGVVVDLYSIGICARAQESGSARLVLSPIYSTL